jgi:hypothetical protein
LAPNTRALAESVNSEFQKIKAAFDQLPTPGSVGSGANPVYTHFAYADSADGTANFTTGTQGTRTYIGVQANVVSPTPSEFPEDYRWTRITGIDGDDGTPGLNGQYRDFRFIRSPFQPATPSGNVPAGSSEGIPAGINPVWVTSALRNGDNVLISAWEPYVRLSALPAASAYNATTIYYEGMQVLFGGGTYILIVPTSTGNAPSGTEQANTWWDVVAAPGSPGTPAVPPSAFSSTIALTSATTAVNLRTIADAAGYTGMSNATITFEVPSGVTIRGVSGGGIGIDSGTWPSSSYTIALTLVVKSGGIVDGGGGVGGDGGSGGPGSNGGNGGDAIFLRENFSGGITIEAGGTVRGGGGGGAGGSGDFVFEGSGFDSGTPYGSAGGGGGGGAPNGQGGLAGTTLNFDEPAFVGSAGSTSGGGLGGAGMNDGDAVGGVGGSGGGFGAAGASISPRVGGAAGFAVRKNGKTATVTNSGTMMGAAS